MGKMGLTQVKGSWVLSNPTPAVHRVGSLGTERGSDLLKDTQLYSEGFGLRTASAFRGDIQRAVWDSPFYK